MTRDSTYRRYSHPDNLFTQKSAVLDTRLHCCRWPRNIVLASALLIPNPGQNFHSHEGNDTASSLTLFLARVIRYKRNTWRSTSGPKPRDTFISVFPANVRSDYVLRRNVESISSLFAAIRPIVSSTGKLMLVHSPLTAISLDPEPLLSLFFLQVRLHPFLAWFITQRG